MLALVALYDAVIGSICVFCYRTVPEDAIQHQ